MDTLDGKMLRLVFITAAFSFALASWISFDQDADFSAIVWAASAGLSFGAGFMGIQANKLRILSAYLGIAVSIIALLTTVHAPGGILGAFALCLGGLYFAMTCVGLCQVEDSEK